MVPGLLNALRSDTDLITEVSPAVFELLPGIIFFGSLIEILFDQVQKGFVIFWHNPRVFKLQDSKLVEGESHVLALLLPSLAFVDVLLDIDDWDLISLCCWCLRWILHSVF